MYIDTFGITIDNYTGLKVYHIDLHVVVL